MTTVSDYSPPLVVDELSIAADRKIGIVRDDLLIGGTKQRAVVGYVRQLMARGHREFIYASPFSGFAQIALAYACSELGAKCVLYCELTPEGSLHEFSLKAQSFGARIVTCRDLAEAHSKADNHSLLVPSSHTIPLGLNAPEFRTILEEEILRHWSEFTARRSVSELWLPVGSGTLLSVFKKVVSASTKIFAVNVNVLPETDARIHAIIQDSDVSYRKAPQRFHDPCRTLPPVPSNVYYDAKLFAFLQREASDGAVWWNVAK